MSGAERIFKLLDETAVESEARAPVEPPATAAARPEAVAFENVSFAYKPGVPVLREVSFHLRPGERLALVGATGAGKSTVTSLLLRLYEFDRGSIRVLGQDVRSYDRRQLRDLFSVVPQDVFLFAGTVASNVAMSDDVPDLALEQLLVMAEMTLERASVDRDLVRWHGCVAARAQCERDTLVEA